jgi:hypothetical protein
MAKLTKAKKVEIIGKLNALVSQRRMKEADAYIKKNSCAALRLSYRKIGSGYVVFSKYDVGSGKNKKTITNREEL